MTDNQHPTKETLLFQQKLLSDFAPFAVKNMSDGVYLISKDARIVYVNPAACNKLGYTEKELLGMRIMDIDPHVTEENWEPIWGVTVRDKIQIIETEHKTAEGRLIPVEVLANYLEIDGEQYSCSFARDITERKMSEKALIKETLRRSILMDRSLDGIAIINQEHELVEANQRFAEMHGYAPGEVIGLHTWDWEASMTEAEIRTNFADLSKTNLVFETRHRRKDGTIFDVEVSANGAKVGDEPMVFTISRDITDRKLAEAALHTSEEKYRLVVENANDAIFIVQNETIKFPNRQTIGIIGYSEDELAGAPFSHFLHADDREMVVNIHRKRLQGKAVPSTYSFRIIKKSGELIWVEASVVLVTWEDSPAALTFLRDITIQKKLEEQLFQSQKMEAIGTLAGGVAHDFNNLLTGIIGYTALMLMETDQSHPFHKKLKIIEQLVESGTELTKQLLGFARGGKYEVKSVNVNDLIIKTSDVFGRTKKEISIHKKLQEDLHTAEADSGQIEQVLMNLFVNAWQAMPSGGNLFLETQDVILDEQQYRAYDAKPGPYVKISVTDTGVGMDDETQKRIFEPFFTTKGVGKGTGLGLASAYGIIKNHGGFINVYSEKGHGATFTLYLPVSGANAAETKPAEDALLTGEETILVVDDEKVNLEMTKELLEKLGYKVMKAQSGKKAIERYRKHSKDIQLVILDMIMPEMNGKETLVKLMEIDKSVCVLLASGYSINGEAKTILGLGCRGFIQKPFRIEELSRKIRAVLNSGNS